MSAAGKTTKAETRYARQLYLYGDGSSAPVKTVAKLCQLAGLDERTIYRHLPTWEKEAEQMAAGSTEAGLALQLSGESLAAHLKDMDFLRGQLSQAKFELDRLEEITAKLEDWLDKFQGDEQTQALQIFDAWQRACASKSSLRSQFLAMQKQWTSLTGIVDLKDVAVIREKEIAKGQAKLQIKRMENETAVTTRNVVAGGVFSRPGDVVEVKRVSTSEDGNPLEH
jgi:hypothetical protein